jgi:glycosyltransferase involved in cell wall biosynthesis
MLARDQKIVILLAAFNGAAHITEQLESFVAQSHRNWELVVSDDGSTDATTDVVQRFGCAVPQKVSLIEGPRRGFWQNFLSLLRRAEQLDGDLFAYSDQDDIWLPEKLERAAEWLAVNGPSEVPRLYFSRTALIEEDGTPAGLSPLFRRPPSFQNALVQNMGGGNTMVMNRAAMLLLAQTPQDVNLIAHDWWTYQVVTGAGGKAFYDPVPSLKYRQHERNLIGSNKGPRQRLLRAVAFANRRMKGWNDVNLEALDKMRSLLSQPALTTLDRFALARRSPLPRRIYLLRRSGIYRQNARETIGVFLGAIFGLI